MLIREGRGSEHEQNSWNIRFMAMFHMSNDSHLFHGEDGQGRLPLYEGKMVQAFDHRAASVKTNSDNIVRAGQPDPTKIDQYEDPDFSTKPQSWVESTEVEARIDGVWNKRWILAFKSVTSPTNERTFIASLIPLGGVANSLICMFPVSYTHLDVYKRQALSSVEGKD